MALSQMLRFGLEIVVHLLVDLLIGRGDQFDQRLRSSTGNCRYERQAQKDDKKKVERPIQTAVCIIYTFEFN